MGFLTGETTCRVKTEEMYHTFFDDLSRQASASPFFMKSLLLTENPKKEVVIIDSSEDPKRKKLLHRLQRKFLPNVAVLVADSPEKFPGIAPFANEYKQLNGQTTVYVCENYACQQPTTDIEAALEMILNDGF